MKQQFTLVLRCWRFDTVLRERFSKSLVERETMTDMFNLCAQARMFKRSCRLVLKYHCYYITINTIILQWDQRVSQKSYNDCCLSS